jgi:intracellular septation protein A
VAKAYLPAGAITTWGYVWSGLMFATAVANLFIALFLGHKAWVAFVGVFPLASKLGLFGIQYASLRFMALRNHRAEQAALAQSPQPA